MKRCLRFYFRSSFYITGFLFFLILFSFHFSFAQLGENPLPFINEEPKFDTAPQFHGGSEALYKYFSDSVRYPESTKTKNFSGAVYLKFMVDTNGAIHNITPINGIPGVPELVKESLRLIEAMPPWIPASKGGKPVEAEYYLSIPFHNKY